MDSSLVQLCVEGWF